MAKIVEQKQMKDFMKLYTGLVERCFDSCCGDFTTRAMTTKEVSKTNDGHQRGIQEGQDSFES